MLGIETGAASNLYKVVLAAHILLSVGGFGGVLLNGVYASQAKKRLGPEGRAISEANYAVSAIAEMFILAVPVSGLVLVWVSDGAWTLTDLWVWASIALFGLAFAISRGALMPGHRRVNQLLAELEGVPSDRSTPQLAELENLGKRMAASGAVLNLLLVIIVVLMIWKPTG